MSEIPTYHIFLKFTLRKDIANMFGDCCSPFAKKHSHLLLSQPNRLVLKQHINSNITIFRLVKDYFVLDGYQIAIHLLCF